MIYLFTHIAGEFSSNVYGPIYAGATTNTFSVVLDRAPDQGLVIKPYGAGVSFTPSTLTFGPGQSSYVHIFEK